MVLKVYYPVAGSRAEKIRVARGHWMAWCPLINCSIIKAMTCYADSEYFWMLATLHISITFRFPFSPHRPPLFFFFFSRRHVTTLVAMQEKHLCFLLTLWLPPFNTLPDQTYFCLPRFLFFFLPPAFLPPTMCFPQISCQIICT